MSEVLPIVFTSSLIILTVILTVVGIQLVLVLAQFRKTLKTINRTASDVELKVGRLVDSMQSLGGIASGVKTGVQVFETFASWLSKRKKDNQDETEQI
ncbi:MAG: hypothetical protein U9O78_04745 [Patescibacteria group bacterium]|nr:hypothetical protein [Patescibacteria group bacterium]